MGNPAETLTDTPVKVSKPQLYSPPVANAVEPPLVCPITGELIPLDDVDALADAYERADQQDKLLYALKTRIRVALAAADKTADPDVKTRRVRGDRRRVTMELPDLSFEQKDLRAIVENFPPAMTKAAISVSAYRVSLTEYKKIANETGPADFLAFKAALTAACKGRVGLPSVKKIEDLKGEDQDGDPAISDAIANKPQPIPQPITIPDDL